MQNTMKHNSEPLVSIIIPVYNSEQYLCESIGSLLKQTYDKIEIICVDDGSTDGSVEILEAYAKRDNRIVLLKQSNMHAGVARNNGLLHASGDYVIFLDSDDIFDRKMISCLVSTMRSKNVDIVIFNYYTFSGRKIFKKKQKISYRNVKKTPHDLSNEIFQVTIGAPWNKFYSMQFVRESGLEFQDTLNSNDIYFTRLSTIYCKNMYFLNKELICYRVNNKASLQGNVNRSPTSFAEAFEAIYCKMEEKNLVLNYSNSILQYAVELSLTAITKAANELDLRQVYDACIEMFKICGITNDNDYVKKEKLEDIIGAICQCNYEKFLSALYFYYVSRSIPNTTIEYRIGKAILQKLGIKEY